VIDLKKALELNELYIPYSTLTKKPYMDNEGGIHIYFRKEEAIRFTDDRENIEINGPLFSRLADIHSKAYAMGATHITARNGQSLMKLALDKKIMAQHFYNPDTNRNLILLKETRNIMHYNAMKECSFLVPVRVKNSLEEGAQISYATVSTGENTPYYYLAFSDMDEYSAWAERVKGWEPLLVGTDILKRIGKHHGVVINPMGLQLVISDEMLKKLPSKKQEEQS